MGARPVLQRILGALLWLACAAGPAPAQVGGGAIEGRVRDAQALAVADAAITLRGEGWLSTGRTSGSGAFRLPNLPPGTFILTIEKPGFASRAVTVMVAVGETQDLTVDLAVGALTVETAVTAVADVADASATTRLTAAQLATIPTPRDLFSLARAVPGVLLDRVNVAGGDTGQQPGLSSKGTRGFDTTWTLDGVLVTDMAAAGSSAFYLNLDNVEAVRFTTSGQDVRQPTGGLGVDVVLPRGTDRWRGGLRFDGTTRGLETKSLPAELKAAGLTPDQADHTFRLLDAGAFGGGPLVDGRLWMHASYGAQDVRVLRGGLRDRTTVLNPSVKLTWRASTRDVVSGLYIDGDKRKYARAPSGTANILLPAATALQRQRNAYAGGPHGLWRVGDDHVFGSRVTASVMAAYVNTGFELTPEGGLEVSSGRSTRLSRSFGSVNLVQNVRPQWQVAGEAGTAGRWWGADQVTRIGLSWRRVDARTRTLWPGNGLLALDNSLVDRRVRVFREGNGANRTETTAAFLQHTVQRGVVSVSGGLRFDHQDGAALASRSAANQAFPDLVPGAVFAGADLPFTWNTFSPRVGVSVAPRWRHPVVFRGSVSRFAGQLPTAIAAQLNPATSVGFREFRWADLNGDQLASADEVLLDQQIQVGGGLSLQALTAPSLTSANRLGVLDAPRTTSAVAGVELDLPAGLVLEARASYERATGVYGVTQTRLGVAAADYTPGPGVRGTLPDGRAYETATFIPSAQAIAAGGGGFLLGTWRGYASGYRGLELALTRRATGRVGGRIAVSLNDAVEHVAPGARYDLFGNPTPTDTVPLVDGGPYAPLSGQMFLNARWQVDATGTLRAPGGVDLAGVVHARQGYPFVPFVPASLGADALSVRILPVDTYRYDTLRLVDLRVSRQVRLGRASFTAGLDAMNLLNSSADLVRVRNAAAANYRQLTGYVTPRILRLSLRAAL